MTPADAWGKACIANIGSHQRRKRLTFGLVLLGVGLVLGLFLVGVGVHRLWRLVLFAPFWLGAVGVQQAREKT